MQRQHYVPQLYLREFSPSDKDTCHVFSWFKENGKIVFTNINNLAVEKDFYTLRQSSEPYSWEKLYSNNIEPLTKRLIDNIKKVCDNALILNHTKVITVEMKRDIVNVLVSQMLRGPYVRELARKKYSTILPEVIKKLRMIAPIFDEKKESLLKAFEANERDEPLKQVLFDVAKNENAYSRIISVMNERNFFVYKIIGDLEFITSDHPVMVVDSSNGGSKPFSCGIESLTSIIYYPITPKLMITSTKKETYWGTLNDKDGSLFFLDSKNEEKFIEGVNRRQVINCLRQAYSRDEKTLRNAIRK